MDVSYAVMHARVHLMTQVRSPAVRAWLVPIAVEICIFNFHVFASYGKQGRILLRLAYAGINATLHDGSAGFQPA
jgi:hypothetical protein